MSQHGDGEQSGDGEQRMPDPVFEPPVEQPPGRSDYVLLVDDDLGIRQIVHDLLDEEGYTITVARTGAEALAQTPEWPPALVLLDSTLPSEHPHEVAAMLRQRAGWEMVPFVLFTATEPDQAAAMAREVGADAVIAKPFDLDVMLAAVARYLAPSHPPASG